jgi:hypothetical protein
VGPDADEPDEKQDEAVIEVPPETVICDATICRQVEGATEAPPDRVSGPDGK